MTRLPAPVCRRGGFSKVTEKENRVSRSQSSSKTESGSPKEERPTPLEQAEQYELWA